MKSTELIRAFTLSLVLATGVACTSVPQEKLDTPIGALDTNSTFALLWIKPCYSQFFGRCEPDDGRTSEAKLAIHGAAELVDLKALYEEDVALSASIARIDAADIVQDRFLRQVKRDMSVRHLNVVAVAKPIHAGALRKIASKRITFDNVDLIGATQYPLDVKANTYELSSLYQQLGVDYLVVMELLRFNIERHFGPTGRPADNPQAVSVIRLYLHEGKTGRVMFDDFAYNVVATDDDWDKPPHYQSLTDSLKQTLHVAIDEAKDNLLGR